MIYLNGKFLKEKEARVSVLEPGFLYSRGLFETLRCRNKKIAYLEEHLKRLKRSCRLIKLAFPFGFAGLKKIIQETVERNGFSDSYIRLTVWDAGGKTSLLAAVKKYRPYPAAKYRSGFSGCISPFRQGEGCSFPRVKSTGYLFYRLSLKEARGRGYDEALILDGRGYLSEGARSNLFFAKGGELFTPALECGCLAGITRAAVFDFCRSRGIKVYVGHFTAGQLYGCDEAFLTNSLIGIMPLTSLEGKPIGRDKCAPITDFLVKKYNCLLK